MARVTLVRQVTWPRLDAWELELVGTICFHLSEFSKHLGRLHCGSNSGVRDGQNPPRGSPPVGQTEVTGERLFSGRTVLEGQQVQQEHRKGGIHATQAVGSSHAHSRTGKEGWAHPCAAEMVTCPRRLCPFLWHRPAAGSSCPVGSPLHSLPCV